MVSFQMRAVLLGVIACSGSAPPVAESPSRFPVAQPEVGDAVVEREYVADIRAVRHAELRSRFKGVLEKVAVDDGQAVTAGQELFAVNGRALEQELLVARAAQLGAEAELRATLLELDNARLLRETNVISAAELALAESKVATARARVEQAKASTARAAVELGFATVKAPFDGVLDRIPRRAGSAIAEDELLTTITDSREVFAYFRVSEREYLQYFASEQPREVALVLADGRRLAARGSVDAVGSQFDRETGTLAYRARFANAEGILKHGSSGKVVVRSDLRGALLVPQKSTFDVQGEIHVFVVDDAGVPHARKVAVKARLADRFVVEHGLERGERFVLDGIQKVKDGARIEITTAAPGV